MFIAGQYQSTEEGYEQFLQFFKYLKILYSQILVD